MPTEFENCPQCGRKGMVTSQAIWSWFPTAPHGFVESLSWQQTGENLSSRMEKVKDARSWAALPLVAVFLFHRELPTYADVILIVATIATYLWASDRHKSAIRKVIDDFFPVPDSLSWKYAALSTKAATQGFFCNMCGLCWERASGRPIAFYKEDNDYWLQPAEDSSTETESYDFE